MNETLDRRAALGRLSVMSLFVVTPSLVGGCSRSANCNEPAGLTPDELKTRNETAKYVEQTPDATKRCSGCALYVAAPKADACGGCTVVKGPINPNGYCVLYVAKPT